jgi:hypothetical protein
MPVPGQYDTAGATIKVAPDNVFQSATVAIPGLGKEIADSVNRVVQIWNDLKLGWVGTTATEAQDFNDRWAADISQLFGSPAEILGETAGYTPGILNQLATGIAMAATNYGQAEDVVTSMFNQTADALVQGPRGRLGKGVPQPPADPTWAVRDVENMPIVERN